MGTLCAPSEQRRELFDDNQWMAGVIATDVRHMVARKIQLDELVNAALLGLWDAAGRFDAGRGVPFKLFAKRKMRWAIFDYARTAIGTRLVHAQPENGHAMDDVLCHRGSDEPAMDSINLCSYARRGLPWRDRVIVILYWFEHLTMPEIAGCLGVSQSLVSITLKSARTQMRERINALK